MPRGRGVLNHMLTPARCALPGRLALVLHELATDVVHQVPSRGIHELDP